MDQPGLHGHPRDKDGDINRKHGNWNPGIASGRPCRLGR
ncbi:MAG: hypothetical protein JWO83_2511 [Caulobacteraceae bacterium]|jgi:hypothetical protein|nr:hypothetical protein [Caulobacteraceae bacterium]